MPALQALLVMPVCGGVGASGATSGLLGGRGTPVVPLMPGTPLTLLGGATPLIESDVLPDVL